MQLITSLIFFFFLSAKYEESVTLFWFSGCNFCFLEQEREEPSLTEWDRFAHREYMRLSVDDDGEDASNGSIEVWEEPFEATL